MNFAKRLSLALSAFFSILGNAGVAESFLAMRTQGPKSLPQGQGKDGQGQSPAPATDGTSKVPPTPSDVQSGANGSDALTDAHRGALHLLAILQRDGRLVDFLKEDISGFSDSDVGAAARAVHEGCRKGLISAMDISPVLGAPEGSTVAVEASDAGRSVTLTGNLAGQPPFKGILCHKGWKATAVRLPATGRDKDFTVIAPAEVEI